AVGAGPSCGTAREDPEPHAARPPHGGSALLSLRPGGPRSARATVADPYVAAPPACDRTADPPERGRRTTLHRAASAHAVYWPDPRSSSTRASRPRAAGASPGHGRARRGRGPRRSRPGVPYPPRAPLSARVQRMRQLDPNLGCVRYDIVDPRRTDQPPPQRPPAPP